MGRFNVNLIVVGVWYGGLVDEFGIDGTFRGYDRGSALLRIEVWGLG